MGNGNGDGGITSEPTPGVSVGVSVSGKFKGLENLAVVRGEVLFPPKLSYLPCPFKRSKE